MKYKKKPVIIEATQIRESTFNSSHPNSEHIEGLIYDPIKKQVEIPTLEGTMIGSMGDYIIKGVEGEYYPCKPDIFAKTYEKVSENGFKDRMRIKNVDLEKENINMNFENALKLLKEGKKLQRKGWNGKEMFVTLIPGDTAKWLGFKMQDCLGLKTVDNLMQPGWNPSQIDMLTEDWELVK